MFRFFKDEVTGENVFVPGKMIDGKNGPRFWPGQVIESEDGDEKFIPGQVINDKFVPGIIVDKVFIPGQVLRTDNGKLFLQYWFHEKKYLKSVFSEIQNRIWVQVFFPPKKHASNW